MLNSVIFGEFIMYKKLSYFIATMFGVGYCPFASGTAGSLATIPFAFAIAYFFGMYGILAATVIVFLIGTYAVKEVLKYTKHDPSIVVIDETAGQLFSFVAVADQLVGVTDWRAALIYLFGFGVFRVFDITKPQPATWADSKVMNAWGVMLDDIFAGAYAAIILYVICIYL